MEKFKTNRQLVEYLKSSGALVTPLLMDAFNTVDRADFIGSNPKTEIYADHPLSIGEDQTISQPSTVAFMLENLQPLQGQKILDVGAGSGWTTALLAAIVGRKGRVIGLEIIQKLAQFGQANLAKYNFPQAEIRFGSGQTGLGEEAPFDRIVVSAAGQNIPPELVTQLKTGGRLIIPVQNSIFRLDKTSAVNFKTQEFPGFSFVPLRGSQMGSQGYGEGAFG